MEINILILLFETKIQSYELQQILSFWNSIWIKCSNEINIKKYLM